MKLKTKKNIYNLFVLHQKKIYILEVKFKEFIACPIYISSSTKITIKI